MDENDYAYSSEPVRSDEIYANLMQEERVKNILAQTSPDNQLLEIEWRIRGYKKNMFTNQWVKINPDSEEMNGLLMERYVSYLSSILNDGTRFGNYSSLEINKLMKLIIEFLADDLNSHADLYNIHGDYTERTRIGHIILNYTFTVLKRGQNGMESQRIWKSLNIGENNSMMPQQQKKGFLQSLKFWENNK